MIDKATVAQILDAADIVEVVSDFVNLRRRGTNYVGLCPFHNEKTPSFSVSRSKGICHCFSCGKGGSPVNFIMEHEQLSYYEALKYLAHKYHIEVKERELTDEERAAQSERESMLIINEFAGKYFEDNLFNTPDGREIGMSYFYERGFSDATIKKFHLGYSLEKSNDLYQSAIKKGFNRQYLFDTGLCIDDKRDGGYDRFKGRVMFPVLNVAGKVIAFGGRTLKHDPAKYINSPESIIYKKSNELYGLFQAKQAIVKKDKCFLVEGYTDVISMHQSGIENVVASSGTSLTEGQIRMIHRFTENVTVLYDGDSAGIKASLRGIDMLLAEGLNIKVLLLPDGDDPDSFARKHNATEFQAYIDENEQDFIQFKIKILLEGVQNDPIKRAAVIGDVVKSIAVIPFPITQSVYAKQCSQQLDIDEKVLLSEIKKWVDLNKKKEFEKKQKENSSSNNQEQAESEAIPTTSTDFDGIAKSESNTYKVGNADSSHNGILAPHEEMVIRYVAKFGMMEFCKATGSDENTADDSIPFITLLEYVITEMHADDIHFTNDVYNQIFNLCASYFSEFDADLAKFMVKVNDEASQEKVLGLQAIQQNAGSVSEIELQERKLEEGIKANAAVKVSIFRKYYLEKKLCSHLDDRIRKVSLDLVSDKHKLSKIHTRYGQVKSEAERLDTLVPQAIYNWKDALILCQVKDNQKRLPMAYASNDTHLAENLLKRIQELYDLRKTLAKYLGDRVVNPKT